MEEVFLNGCQQLQGHLNLVDRRLGLGEPLARALQRLERCNGDVNSPLFPKDSLIVTAVIALRSGRPVVVIEGLNLIYQLLVEGLLAQGDILLDKVPLMSTLSPLIVGKPAVWVLLEGLCHVMQSDALETAIQMKAVSCVATISSDLRLPLAGHVLTTTVQACFNLALTSSCAGTQERARQVLRATLRDRVARPVVDVAAAHGGSPDTTVPAFMMHAAVHRPDLDADPVEYLPRFVVPRAPRMSFSSARAADMVEATFGRLRGGSAAAAAAAALDHFEEVPPSLRDIVNILESFFALATQSIPSTVKSPDEVEVRTRQLALDCITCILLDFPEVHGARQDLSVLAPMLVYVEDSLWEAIGVNIATTAPSSFFVSAVHLLGLVATRAHYTLFPGLRKFFERVVFPLVKSRYSTLEQKVGLLSVVRSIFAKPELVVAYFCNYDCLAPLEHDVGLLQLIVQNVVETAFLDYTTTAVDNNVAVGIAASASPASSGAASAASAGVSAAVSNSTANGDPNVWVMLTGMQQASLRCECLSLVGMLVEALWRWLEEPLPPHLLAQFRSQLTQQAVEGRSSDVMMPATAAAKQQHVTIEAAAAASGLSTPNALAQADADAGSKAMSAIVAAAAPAAASDSIALTELGEPENAPSTLYHWKHVHHALANRLVELEARFRFEQSWKQGRLFLMEHGVLARDAPAADFAWWIRSNSPALKRGQVVAIFEKMLRDPLCAEIVAAYIRTFDFRHKYVDTCLRDLLVSLMADDSIPKFESQILERIMSLFAAAYHEQNANDPDPACALTEDDVDGMANAALMLHTANHNPLIKDKMSADHFCTGAAMIVKKPLSEAYWRGLFERVNGTKWSPPVGAVTEQCAAQEWRASLWRAVPSKPAAYAHLWGGSMASHSEYFASLRLSEQLQLRYIQRAAECFAAFKAACGGRAAAVRAETRQAAYCAPFYAAHVRLMLRLLYPVIAVAGVLASKMCFTGPQITLAQTLNHHVAPLLSLFGIDASSPQLRADIAELFQRMLEQEHASKTAFAGHPGLLLLASY